MTAQRARGLVLGLSALALVGEPRCVGSASNSPRSQDGPTSGPGIRFVIDGSKSHPISRFIYGVNFRHTQAFGANDAALTTLNRLGGNRLTSYNWLTNESNCGADCGESFPNDLFLAQDLENPRERGGFVRSALDATFARGTAGLMVTVPIAGYVAADHAGSTLPIPVAASPNEPAVPNRHFKRSEARNPRGANAEPDPSGDVVYQDDFVKWIQRGHPAAAGDPLKPLFFQLDNEPDLWGSTHPEIRGRTASGKPALLGFEELVTRTVDYAGAVKDVMPVARVFSPPLANWFGFWGLGHSTRPAGHDWYIDYYLEKLKEAQDKQGRRLVDTLAVHWYPESRNECRRGETPCWSDRITNDWQPQTPSVIDARVQAPRSLWDPSYTEQSWVSENIPGCWARACPVQLIPRLKSSIAAHYPGTGVAVTEYYFGRGGDISGGIAQADVLGVFGREGVTAAALWPAAQVYAWNNPAGSCDGDVTCATLAYRCLFDAFKAFLDYDGKGGHFGDTSISAQTSHVEETSVYASTDTSDPGRVVMVAINKTPEARDAEIVFSNVGPFSRAEVFRVTGGVGTCVGPRREPEIALAMSSGARVGLPPMSIGIYVFRP
jgi:hypothetical protein